MKKNKIVIALTGASGSIYANVLLDKLVKLQDQFDEISLVMSDNSKVVWQHELGHSDFQKYPFKRFEKMDFYAPFASGSARYNMMVICPCSMGTMARIASGISNDLISRAADVMLKERGKLILVTRDTPLNLIHINNMRSITEAGGIICPASPSFYSKPQTHEEIAATVIDRVIDLLGIDNDTFRWGK